MHHKNPSNVYVCKKISTYTTLAPCITVHRQYLQNYASWVVRITKSIDARIGWCSEVERTCFNHAQLWLQSFSKANEAGSAAYRKNNSSGML